MTDVMSGRNGRSEVDILSRSGIPLILGGRAYAVRPRSIKSNRQWKERVQRALEEKFGSLDNVGGMDSLYAFASESGDVLLDLVIAYDETNVLPDRETIEDTATDHEITEAFMVLLEQAFPFFEIGRRTLPAEMRGIIIGRLVGTVLLSLSERSTSEPSTPGATPPRRRSKTR